MSEMLLQGGANGFAHTIVLSRRGPVRVATIHDEEWIDGEPIADPEALVRSLRDDPPADIFTFARSLPECDPCYSFHFEWDNVAVANLANGFSSWWEALPQETRKNVRRSQRRGVTVQPVAFDDPLIRGVSSIYNETPIRQGRKFSHYRKTFAQVRAANATYLDRSEFIGAFFNGELIGFIKFVLVNNVARIMQIISMETHVDKRPTNALLAKAIEICCTIRATHLVYGKYVYGRKETSPVTEFKKRNGFGRLNFPRYYVPLTRVGALALRCGVHLGVAQFVPENITNLFLAARSAFYRRRFRLRKELHKGTPIARNLPVRGSSITTY